MAQGHEREASSDSPQPIEISFLDLRDPKQAKKIGIEPGIYFNLEKVPPSAMVNPLFLPSVGDQIMSILFEKDLVKSSSEGRIPIGESGRVAIDTSAAWKVDVFSYDPEKQKLLLKAVSAPQEGMATFGKLLRRQK